MLWGWPSATARSRPTRSVRSSGSRPSRARATRADNGGAAVGLVHLQAEEKARRRDLPGLFFILPAGVRVVEALAVIWSEVDFDAARCRSRALLSGSRASGCSGSARRAGRGADLAASKIAVAMLRRRFMTGACLDHPLFPDVNRGFRDPANARRELREARKPRRWRGSPRTPSGKRRRRSLMRRPCQPAWLRTSSGTAGRRRHRTSTGAGVRSTPQASTMARAASCKAAKAR